MYDLYAAFVTVSVLVFIAIYNTSFITVVTLGGTVLGSAVIGFCSVLLAFLLHKMFNNRLVRCALEMIGCGCAIWVTAACFPGWEIKVDVSTTLFLLILYLLVTAFNEYILNK